MLLFAVLGEPIRPHSRSNAQPPKIVGVTIDRQNRAMFFVRSMRVKKFMLARAVFSPAMLTVYACLAVPGYPWLRAECG